MKLFAGDSFQYFSKIMDLKPTKCSNYTVLSIFSLLFLYSCFANVVLQCLTYTQPLAAYLLEGIHSEHCKYILSLNYTCVTTIVHHLLNKGLPCLMFRIVLA